MELRRVVWSWETALIRLCEREPALGRAAQRSCRPIAAERGPDGRLRLIIASWWGPDLDALSSPLSLSRLSDALSVFLDDQVRVQLVAWPAGLAPAGTGGDPDEVSPPDLLADLPTEAREAARACASALERLLYARAWARGLELVPQYQTLSYRLDLALPRARLGAEVVGWEGLRRGGRWEREQHLDAESWRVFYFPGSEVHQDVNRCVEALLAAARQARRA